MRPAALLGALCSSWALGGCEFDVYNPVDSEVRREAEGVLRLQSLAHGSDAGASTCEDPPVGVWPEAARDFDETTSLEDAAVMPKLASGLVSCRAQKPDDVLTIQVDIDPGRDIVFDFGGQAGDGGNDGAMFMLFHGRQFSALGCDVIVPHLESGSGSEGSGLLAHVRCPELSSEQERCPTEAVLFLSHCAN